METTPAPGRPLRIGVVAYELEGDKSGVGRYLEGLLSGLAELSYPSEWLLFFKGEPFESPLFGTDPAAEKSITFRPVFDHRPEGSAILWEQIRLPGLLRQARLDALVSPGYSLPPFVGVPRMVTLHDLSFEHLGAEFATKERWRRRILARLAARRGDRILVDTAAMAQDLRSTYGLPAHKVGVVPLAVDRQFFAPVDRLDLEELGIRRPYLLHLGTLLPRRRVDLIIESFASLTGRFPDLRLVLAGHNRLPDPTELDRLLARSGIENRVTRLDYVPESQLVRLYAGAEAGFYLSTYEGFGLPPLELLATGTPAVVSRGLALDDLAPDYPWRTPLDSSSVAATLERVLMHDNPPASIRGARQAISEVTWRSCAEIYWRQLLTAIADHRAEPRRETG